MNEGRIETKQERREKKLKKKRERIPKHGKNRARIDMDAVLKRLKGKGKYAVVLDGL